MVTSNKPSLRANDGALMLFDRFSFIQSSLPDD